MIAGPPEDKAMRPGDAFGATRAHVVDCSRCHRCHRPAPPMSVRYFRPWGYIDTKARQFLCLECADHRGVTRA